MELFEVNHDLCLNCGVCAAVCPNGLIGMSGAGPQLLTTKECMACGHCVAVCPQAALDYQQNPLGQQTPLGQFPVITAVAAQQFLRARRSIRNYQKRSVAREIILKLLDIARYAPTGGNSQGLSYLVVDEATVLQQITAVVIDWVEAQIKKEVAWAKGYAGNVARYRQNGSDVVLRQAPCLVVALAPQGFSRGHDNARYCLEYVELYATALGLGTCWAGFVERAAADNFQPLLKVLQLPADRAVVGAMMVGYPQYTYKRLVAREPLQVTWR
jgi:nitroreductase/NAD-dependent dihydropyrimidine dehydrogenase PreA subunit